MKFVFANYIKSSSSGAYTTSSASYVDVTNLSVSFKASGFRPVFVGLQADPAAGSRPQLGTIDGASDFRLRRDSSTIGEHGLRGPNPGTLNIPVPSLWVLDFPAAGTYTYKLQASIFTAATAQVTNALLVVCEL